MKRSLCNGLGPSHEEYGIVRVKILLGGLALAAALLVPAMSGVTAASASTASSTTHASKSAFCGADVSIDKASAGVTTSAGFLAVLKSHPNELKAMQMNAPSGSLGQRVQEVLKAVDKAISANNTNAIDNLPDDGGVIDTYCGVDGQGQPLPAYWNTGTHTAFCTTFIPVYQAVGNAHSQAEVLSVLMDHKAQVSTLASELSKLPSSIKAIATNAVGNAQKVISEKNAALLTGNGNGPATKVALYCGQNR